MLYWNLDRDQRNLINPNFWKQIVLEDYNSESKLNSLSKYSLILLKSKIDGEQHSPGITTDWLWHCKENANNVFVIFVHFFIYFHTKKQFASIRPFRLRAAAPHSHCTIETSRNKKYTLIK